MELFLIIDEINKIVKLFSSFTRQNILRIKNIRKYKMLLPKLRLIYIIKIFVDNIFFFNTTKLLRRIISINLSE